MYKKKTFYFFITIALISFEGLREYHKINNKPIKAKSGYDYNILHLFMENGSKLSITIMNARIGSKDISH